MSEERAPYGRPDQYTAEQLREFAEQVRAKCDEALARLAALDPETLTPELRAKHHESVKRWQELRALTESDALALHEQACLYAGRELTQEEARGLLGKQ